MLYSRYIKRILDILFSLLFILLLSPVYIVLSFCVLVFHGTPIIFVQQRVGYKERIFNMYKYRSMTDLRDKNGELLPNNLRITKLGKFLRKTSLDELPELFNILKGDMSFVGPRPLLTRYLPYYELDERKRHQLRPGLTGLSQVKGRNKITWREKFKYDIEYVENISILLDIKIFLLTIMTVLTSRGVADHGEVKTDEFGDYLLYEGKKFRPLDKEREYEKFIENNGTKNE
ncbi:MAG TPA: sugar transferase [Methanothermobacter sp.]|nr:sugar transferase [Methanothermobacter sp.]